MLSKLKCQIPGSPLAARYNWCQGPYRAAARRLRNTGIHNLVSPWHNNFYFIYFKIVYMVMTTCFDLHWVINSIYGYDDMFRPSLSHLQALQEDMTQWRSKHVAIKIHYFNVYEIKSIIVMDWECCVFCMYML